MVCQWRTDGGQQSDLPAELIGTGQNDQRQRREDDTALRYEVELSKPVDVEKMS